ncbi:tandem-95 repeat protein, partial [Roseimaritima sediminicola]|uniref:tandem-95 repeat protein n=1 Tax=Roseimaritima sediminicola TaxID=2662066 RepID=UPI0012984571
LTQPTNGSAVVNNDGAIVYTPSANFHGIDTFTYTTSDGAGGTATATVTVTVNPVNDAPAADDDTATTDEDTAVTIDVLANDRDVDKDTLTVSQVTQPTNGSAVVNDDG